MRNVVASESMSAQYAQATATWFSKGYAGQGNVADLLDSQLDRPAIIAGSAHGVFYEVSAAKYCLSNPLIFAVNDVGVFLPHVDHFVSLHTSRLDMWVDIRRDPTGKPYGNTDFQVHDGGLYGERPWHQWTGLTPMMALSGLFAAQIAYLMGCTPIVLAGCPTDATPRFWEIDQLPASYYKATQEQVKAEMGYKPEFKNEVRSMSGWSKDFFGSI